MVDTESVSTPPAATTPVKPETWEQEIWDKLVAAEKWIVADLHDMGVIFADDVWPSLKAGLVLLGSQLGATILATISANITDPALIPAAVGSALLITASTSGVTDAKTALASAQAAVDADPNVQALLPT